MAHLVDSVLAFAAGGIYAVSVAESPCKEVMMIAGSASGPLAPWHPEALGAQCLRRRALWFFVR